ncbi:MAG: ATP-binding cassette domain-containing protein [Staphylococcus aureus]|nr:ATP-binding cassette domain-containing protein [Staphylococcus aureus]
MSIQFNQVSYIYQQGTPYEFEAIKNVSLTLEQGKYYAIIGQTGSGKSTLIQHLNALLKPTTGSVNINGLEVTNKTKDKHLRHIRKEVGVVFQFPESQLFEDSVEKEIEFGPKNFNMNLKNVKDKAFQLLLELGFSRNVMSSSPFQMSGGQMRKIAIVSILAMDPQVIIGTIVEKSNPRNLFNQKTQLLKWHIELPKVVKLQKDIEKKYNMLFPKLATNEEEFVKLYKEWHHEE